jgi:hypothetical protein
MEAKEAKLVLNFDHQIAGQSHDTVMANRHSENVAKSKHQGTDETSELRL